jgi:hypothetical protein
VRSLYKVAIVGAASLSGLLVGGSVMSPTSGTGTPPPPPSQRNASVVPLVVSPIDTAIESKYTVLAPCRIVDTRSGGGKIAAGASRSFYAAGAAGFIAQGGNIEGCGIPSTATAIAVTIVAVDATGPGFLRAWAYGGTTPVSSMLNYQDSSAVTGSGNIPITGIGARHFTVSANSHATDVVVDVQGYFIASMSARVNLDGTLAHGSRVTGTVHVATGQYEVDFDRNVSQCTYTVNPYYSGYVAVAQPRALNAKGVWIGVATLAGAGTDTPVYLTVTC